MDNITIHPKFAEISYHSNNVYTQELIKHLARKDCGRSRTQHRSSIEEIKAFHNQYTLGAEQYIEPKRKSWMPLAACALIVLVIAAYAYAWQPDPDMAETIAQARYVPVIEEMQPPVPMPESFFVDFQPPMEQ
jgi:hypothetical protein